MEDFELNIVVGQGPGARTMKLAVKPFTMVGATTRSGLLSSPLRDRFGQHYHLDFYSHADLSQIIRRSAHLLGVRIDDAGAIELAKRARGTPRIANRLLRRVRDFAEVKAAGMITPQVACEALKLEGVDDEGLDDLDRNFLSTIIRIYKGGPVGVEALSATLNEEVDTLVDMVEPYLLQQGFISRTKAGRKANEPAYKHLKLKAPDGVPPKLFE